MKRSLKYLSVLALAFIALTFTAQARVITDEELENAYVIGTHLFTEEGIKLDTETIMLAARTIEDNIEPTDVWLEDMIIYFKPAGEDRWINALTNEEIAEPQGIRENNYFTHINLEEQVDSIGLSGVTNVVTDNVANDQFGENIIFNQKAISIDYAENTIHVSEEDFMKSWNNGVANEKWYAVLIDLGIFKDRIKTIEGSDYEIADVDKADAEKFGATNSNQFILWLRGAENDTSRVITFVDNETGETVDITINFTAKKAEATTRTELEEYLANPNIATIYLANDLTDLTSRIIVNREVVIEGNNHTLSFTEEANSYFNEYETHGIIISADNVIIRNLKVEMTANQNMDLWDGVYGIQAYNSKNVILENVSATGADGGIFSNNSEVTLKGTIDVTGNEFGGIEVSNGSSVLHTQDATLVNNTEKFKKPTIWTDSTGVTVNTTLAETTVYKEDGETFKPQQQYYLYATNIETAEGTTSIDEILVSTNLEKPTTISSNGSATIFLHKSYSQVRFEIRNVEKPENAQIKVWAKATNGEIWDMIENGWGPENGFSVPAGYEATTPFQIVANTAGEYRADIVLVDVTNNEVVTTINVAFTVKDQA